MSKPLPFLAAFCLLSLFPGSLLRADAPANPARNPVVWADVPDLSMIRVGDTYYMSSTTAHMSPHVPS